MGDVLRAEAVSVVRDRVPVLAAIDWVVAPSERWVVIGPNGSGKTTLLQVAGARLHPSSGSIEVLGERLGASDWRAVRARVGFVSGALVRTLRPSLPVLDVVMTGKHGALEPWWHTYSHEDRARARGLLAASGVEVLAPRTFGVISEGERQQVLLARMLMAEPGLLLLDEPFAGLDLGARERLLDRLAVVTTDPATPPLVLVTHHVEEIPRGVTHAMLLRAGRVVAAGPVDDALTDASVGEAFGLRVDLGRDGHRWWVRARR